MVPNRGSLPYIGRWRLYLNVAVTLTALVSPYYLTVDASSTGGARAPLYVVHPIETKEELEQLAALAESQYYKPKHGVQNMVRYIWRQYSRNKKIGFVVKQNVSGANAASEQKGDEVVGGIVGHVNDAHQLVIDSLVIPPGSVACIAKRELVEAFCDSAEQRFFVNSSGTPLTSVEFVVPASDVSLINMLERIGFRFSDLDFRGFPLSRTGGAAIMKLDFPRKTPIERLVERIEQLKAEVKTLSDLRSTELRKLAEQIPEVVNLKPSVFSAEQLIDFSSEEIEAEERAMFLKQARTFLESSGTPFDETRDLSKVCAMYNPTTRKITAVGFLPFNDVSFRIVGNTRGSGYRFAKIMNRLLQPASDSSPQDILQPLEGTSDWLHETLHFLGFTKSDYNEMEASEFAMSAPGIYFWTANRVEQTQEVVKLQSAGLLESLLLLEEVNLLKEDLARIGEVGSGHMTTDRLVAWFNKNSGISQPDRMSESTWKALRTRANQLRKERKAFQHSKQERMQHEGTETLVEQQVNLMVGALRQAELQRQLQQQASIAGETNYMREQRDAARKELEDLRMQVQEAQAELTGVKEQVTAAETERIRKMELRRGEERLLALKKRTAVEPSRILSKDIAFWERRAAEVDEERPQGPLARFAGPVLMMIAGALVAMLAVEGMRLRRARARLSKRRRERTSDASLSKDPQSSMETAHVEDLGTGVREEGKYK